MEKNLRYTTAAPAKRSVQLGVDFTSFSLFKGCRSGLLCIVTLLAEILQIPNTALFPFSLVYWLPFWAQAVLIPLVGICWLSHVVAQRELPGTAELQLWGLDTYILLLANMLSLASTLQPPHN